MEKIHIHENEERTGMEKTERISGK